MRTLLASVVMLVVLAAPSVDGAVCTAAGGITTFPSVVNSDATLALLLSTMPGPGACDHNGPLTIIAWNQTTIINLPLLSRARNGLTIEAGVVGGTSTSLQLTMNNLYQVEGGADIKITVRLSSGDI